MITIRQKISMIVWHVTAAIGFIGIGVILSTAFFFTEEEFWANVERFWR